MLRQLWFFLSRKIYNFGGWFLFDWGWIFDPAYDARALQQLSRAVGPQPLMVPGGINVKSDKWLRWKDNTVWWNQQRRSLSVRVLHNSNFLLPLLRHYFLRLWALRGDAWSGTSRTFFSPQNPYHGVNIWHGERINAITKRILWGRGSEVP